MIFRGDEKNMLKKYSYIPKTVLIVFLFCLLTNWNSFIVNGIQKASPIKPTIPAPVISGFKEVCKPKDTMNLKITSSNTKLMVQYKIILVNETTNDVYDITKGYTKKYYNPSTPYSLKMILNKEGTYTLTVNSQLAGYKSTYNSSVAKKFIVSSKPVAVTKPVTKPITKPSTTPVKVEIARIDSISMKISVGDNFTLPTQIPARMTNGTIQNVPVTWNTKDLDTSSAESQTFLGTVKNYIAKVQLTLTIVDDRINSISDISVSVNEGQDYKLPDTVKTSLENGTTKDVKVLWSGNSDTSKTGTYNFEGTVDKYNSKVKLELRVLPVELKLDSIVSDNLREITLYFNKRIDSNSVRNESIRLYKNNQIVSTVVSVLDSDKSILIQPANDGTFDNDGSYTLVIENLKDLNGNIYPRTLKEVIVADNNAPELKKVTATSPGAITMEFSEPIKSYGYEIVVLRSQGKDISANGLSGFGTNKISVALSQPMTDNVTYTIATKNFGDYANNPSALKNFQFLYKPDVTKPTASIDNADGAVVIVKFNKQVVGLSKENFYHTNTSCIPLGIYSNPEMTNGVLVNQPVDKVWIRFYDTSKQIGYPLDENVKALVIKSKVGNTELKDNWGNKFDDVSLPISVVVDKTVPEVKSVVQETENSISIEFSKEVNFNTSNIEILDENSKKIDGLIPTVFGSGKKYIVNLNKSLVGRNIKINIANVIDKGIVPNKLALYSMNLAIKDKTPPQVDKILKKFITGIEQNIYVYYNKPVSNSAATVTNYYLQNPANSNSIKLSGEVKFVQGSNTNVQIAINDSERALIEAGYNLLVTNISDINGNILPAQTILNSKLIDYNSNLNKPAIVKAQAIDKRTLVINLNQPITSSLRTDLFTLNGATPSAISLSTTNEGNTVVTLTCADGKEFAADFSNNPSLVISSEAGKEIKNAFDLGIDGVTIGTSTAVSIENKIVPNIKIVDGKQQIKTIVNTSSQIEAVSIEYDKDIDSTCLSRLSYLVEGSEVAKVYTNSVAAKSGTSVQGHFVIIELKTTTQTDTKVIVTQVLDIYDMNGNKLSPNGVSIVAGN